MKHVSFRTERVLFVHFAPRDLIVHPRNDLTTIDFLPSCLHCVCGNSVIIVVCVRRVHVVVLYSMRRVSFPVWRRGLGWEWAVRSRRSVLRCCVGLGGGKCERGVD